VIDVDRLIAAALGELDDDAAAVVDEHLLGCSPCAATLDRLIDLGDAVRALVGAGEIAFTGAGSLVDRLERAGLVSRTYRIAPGHRVPCAVGAADIYAVTHLEADLTGVRRVDLLRTMAQDTQRTEDVPFDPGRGRVSLLTPSALLRTLPSMRIDFALVAVDDSGERVIGQYGLDHTGFAG
jgi:hypothetical protein